MCHLERINIETDRRLHWKKKKHQPRPENSPRKSEGDRPRQRDCGGGRERGERGGRGTSASVEGSRGEGSGRVESLACLQLRRGAAVSTQGGRCVSRNLDI